MNWELHKEKLLAGETVQFRPRGNSMTPRIQSGQLVTVEPVVAVEDIKKGDIVFCVIKGRYYVHLVSSVRKKMGGMRFQIGNNHGKTNGWIYQDKVFGVVRKVED